MCLGMPELAEMAALLTAPGIPQPVELPGDDYNEEEEEEEENDDDDDEDEADDEEAPEAAVVAAAAAVPSTRNDGLEPLGMLGGEALFEPTELIPVIARRLSKKRSPNFPAPLACVIADRRHKLDLVYLVYTSPQSSYHMYRLGRIVLFLKNSRYHEQSR